MPGGVTPGPGYAVDVTPADLGVRVTLRRRLTGTEAGPPGAPTHGDLLGELVRWSDGVLAVRRRDGSVVEVPADTVVALKRVPPPPARRRP